MNMANTKIVLPADVYSVVNKTIITELDRKNLTMLYQPIIGSIATTLFFTFLDDLQYFDYISNEFTHHHLMSKMQMSIDDIIIARKKLEGIGLLKTYFKKDSINNYIYVLYSPLSPNDFFNHPILNVVLYNNVGKIEYDKIINCYKLPRLNIKDYDDITLKFDEVFYSAKYNNFEEHKDLIKQTKKKLEFSRSIDFDMLITSIPSNMINEKEFNAEIRDLINSLSYTYNIDELSMQGLIRNCINEKGSIDKKLLRKGCRDFYQFENSGKLPTLVYSLQPNYLKEPEGNNSKRSKMLYMFESVTPYDYLKSKYKGGEPTSRDLSILENLMVDQKINPGVLNVLIYYTLRVNNQKLNKNYVETIAGQWKRSGVETVESAMQMIEKEYKKVNNGKTGDSSKVKYNTRIVDKSSTTAVPEWFDKENKAVITDKNDEEEMKKILEELV